MRQLRPLAFVVGAAALLALLALGAVTMLRPTGSASVAQQADAIAAELRCPTCEGLSVADSPSAPAAEIRRQVAALLAEGRSPDEVKRHFVDRYGEWILLAPSAPWAWLVPPVAIGLAGVALVAWIRRSRPTGGAGTPGRGRSEAPDAEAATARYGERVREELEALDA